VRRGDLVVLVAAGEEKPRLALIIQSDLFAEHPSLCVLPVTSELRETPLFRVPLIPNEVNRLQQPYEVMADKVQTVARHKVGDVKGHVQEEDMLAISRALAVFLGVV